MPRDDAARFAQIKKVFNTYDRSGDGFLDISELETVLKTLGTFNNHEVAVVCASLDSSNDGQISYPEFVDWVKKPTNSKELLKAKAVLAPTDDDGLKVVFYSFCGAGRSDMDGKAFMKMCKDCNLIDKNLTEISADLLFSNTRVKKKGQRTIGFSQFEVALELVAAKKGMGIEEVRDIVLTSTRPVLQGTKALPTRFHDDPRCLNRENSDSTLSSHSKGSKGSKGRAEAPQRREPLSRKAVHFDEEHEHEPEQKDHKADNKDLWRTFGIAHPAGRTLKRLYSLPFRADLPEGSPRRSTAWPPQQDTYVAVNSLKAMTAGLHFRKSMHVTDLCRGSDEYVPWGAAVQGDRVDACWLRIGERYLPTEVNGTRLLRRWDGPGPHPSASSGGLIKASSLPSLRSPSKPSFGARILMGVPARRFGQSA